jgi:hypothetical protein
MEGSEEGELGDSERSGRRDEWSHGTIMPDWCTCVDDSF